MATSSWRTTGRPPHQDPRAPPQEVEFAAIWCEHAQVRVTPARSQTHLVEHDDLCEVVPREAMALKNQPGGELSIGGADLSASFLLFELIDEYRLQRASSRDRARPATARGLATWASLPSRRVDFGKLARPRCGTKGFIFFVLCRGPPPGKRGGVGAIEQVEISSTSASDERDARGDRSPSRTWRAVGG